MAPASRSGYALLPTSDLAEAGGSVRPSAPVRIELPKVSPFSQARGQPDEGSGTAAVDASAKLGEVVGGIADFAVARYDGGRRFDRSAPCYIIHPHSTGVRLWYFVLTILLAVDVAYLPLESAFARYMRPALMLWLNAMSTLLFTLDIGLQFFLQAPSESGEFWLYDHHRIIRRYLRGDFAVDVISVVPISELQFVLSGGSRCSWLLHILRCVKLLRLTRFWRMNQRYTYDIALSYASVTMVRACTVVMVSIHVMSCLWSTMADYQDGESWLVAVDRAKTKDDWDVYFTPEGTLRPLVSYIASTYFALYTLTGVGCGDITPTTAPEFFCCSGMMLVASLIWAMVIGEIVNILRLASHDELEHRETMDTLIALGRHHDLPHSLRARLREFFKQRRFLAGMNFMQEKVLAKMTSGIAVELVSELHGAWLDNVWWLHSVRHSHFMVQLALAFDPALYTPQERVKELDRLFVVRRGVCMHGVKVLTKDQCWNLDFMLLQGHLRRLRTTIAISYLHVLFLRRDMLNQTLEYFPKERRLVRRAYRFLCLTRGVVYEARKIAAAERRRRRLEGRQSTVAGTPMAQASMRPSVSAPVSAKPSRASTEAASDTPDFAHGDTILQAQERISSLEEEVGQRIERVEEQLRQVLEALRGGAAQPKSRGGAAAGAGVRHLLD